MAYWRLHYHFVWGTFPRLPLLTAARERVVHDMLSGKCQELRVQFHALGNTADHLHLVVSVPPTLPIAECIRHLKGASSHAANRMSEGASGFRWQDGYGALTVSEDQLPRVVAYVRHQKRHHATHTLLPLFEQTDLPATD